MAHDSFNVYLIRHGEKPANSGQGLSAQGVERAQCLRKVFGASSSYDIGYIIAEQPDADGDRARPSETVEPLAQDLGLTVDTSVKKNNADGVAKLVHKFAKHNDGNSNVLVCWEHGVLTDIATALGVEDAPEYPGKRFDLIWTIPYGSDAITAVTSEDCPGLDS